MTLILAHFPRSQEGRQLRHLLAANPEAATGPDAVDELDRRDWGAVFALLSRRYAHLSAARPWRTQKLRTLKDPDRLRAVNPWNRFLRLDKKIAPFHYWDPSWTLSAADGLLVYPAGQPGAAAEPPPPHPYDGHYAAAGPFADDNAYVGRTPRANPTTHQGHFRQSSYGETYGNKS